jgi:hypothetical protein
MCAKIGKQVMPDMFFVTALLLLLIAWAHIMLSSGWATGHARELLHGSGLALLSVALVRPPFEHSVRPPFDD